MAEKRKFNSAADFEVRFASGEIKTCVCRFPTDAEWSEYVRSHRAIRSDLGRGKSETRSIGIEAAAAVLLGKIRKSQTAELVDADSAAVIERLERAIPIATEMDGGSRFRVTLRSWGIDTAHLLRIPTQREIQDHERASARRVSIGHGKQEIRAALEPSGALYDQVAISTDGYEGAVPIIHKVVAVNELLRAIEIELDDSDPES